jgi:uncharacterized protein
MLLEPDYVKEISAALSLKPFQVEVILAMIEEGDTIPFIARYRKERTGNLDEEDIREIIAQKAKRESLFKAKQTAINGIEEQEKMTPDLMAKIVACQTLKEVEDIYKPYKLKKKTKAMIAIEKGFQGVADEIKQGASERDIKNQFGALLSENSLEEILEGAQCIISAEISSEPKLRSYLKNRTLEDSQVIAKKKSDKMLEKLKEKDAKQIPKFELYADFNRSFKALKPYQILALNRGEQLGILNVKIDKTELMEQLTQAKYFRDISYRGDGTELLEAAFKDGYTVLFKSLENEIRSDLAEDGEDDAIASFRSNLEALLMTKPEYGQMVLAIDPGYRAGCKIVVLDTLGTPIHFDKIFLHQADSAKKTLEQLLAAYVPEVIVLGNGAGSDETLDLIQSLTKTQVYIVNESGASVYSASKIAQEEFPDLDSLDRGTISIGRRYIDPLSELVKVPVEAIGVGMYQHDMPVKKLEERLGYTVEDVVNKVGINVNSASTYVLNHIAGIDKRAAKKIFNHRPYKSREALKKVLSDKVYEQSTGFLRVPESSEELDNTDIHPDQYALTRYFLQHRNEGAVEAVFEAHKEAMIKLYPEATSLTLEFIAEAYDKIGKEERVHSSHRKAEEKIDPNSIIQGSVVSGVVRNVVAFGAFVDIGLKNDGLLHVSQIANKFISNPAEELEVGQRVKVKVLSMENGKIQLSMKAVPNA